MFDIKKIIKLVFAVFLSYVFSNFFIKNIFLANSPKIRPNLGEYFLAKINNAKENLIAKFNFDLFFSSTETDQSLAEKQTIELLKNSLKPVTKGIRGSSIGTYSYTEFKLKEIEWARITYTLKDGRMIIIEYPKDQEPPPKEVFED